MTAPDHRQTELYDTGDAWLAFFAMFFVWLLGRGTDG
jgi:hypothetical protein